MSWASRGLPEGYGEPSPIVEGSWMVTLRLYQSDDLEQVVHLWYTAWHRAFPGLHHPQTYDEWKQRFRDEIAAMQTVWVAEVDGNVAGFLAMNVDDGYIDQFFVDVAFQRQGIGASLMGKAKDLFPAGLSLHTLETNTSARGFWEKHGFHAGHKGVNAVNGQPNVEYRWQP
jgi:ribosomal protein S18 acetylase RimI-like enzyme